MKRPRFVVSLTTTENDYQMEQSKAAEDAARKLGVDLQLLYADNDTITQSQQLLNIIQSRDSHPDGILFEPVGGTALPQVGRAAVAAGIAWVVLNREIEYIADLRRAHRVPIFTVAANHEEVGRIQAKQVSANKVRMAFCLCQACFQRGGIRNGCRASRRSRFTAPTAD